MALDGNSLQKSKWKYHVFLSFRGEDTRLNFTDHLFAALDRKCIITFRDDEDLDRGEVISQKLHHAIDESLFAIVIISPNYASSTWCLDELQKIVESKQRLDLEVFPIFHGVDPSDVRYQRGIFEEAFRKHTENFPQNEQKVEKWRSALYEVANLSGWHSKNQHETELIEEIVEQVWTKLEPKLATYDDGLIAIDAKVEDMYSHLGLGSKDVRFIGIWGMGGIGKTTLANVVFKKIRSQFDISCFLANVREASMRGDECLVHLQKKLLSHVRLNRMIIETSSQGKDNIRNLLHNKKVLLVLDDVSAKSQLENLAGNPKWFGPESRIIVTTRDKHLLDSHGVLFEMYEIKTLDIAESFKLFCEKAFKVDKPKEGYLELSKQVVEHAGGLPLALEVLGSFLCGRSAHVWKDALSKISHVSHDILKILQISYDMLEDEHKTIFLDIACFFKGWYKDKVTEMLGSCGLHATIGINVLIEKSLVTCNGSVLGMHGLLEEMGKTIVFQESPDDPGRRSRLWSLEDSDQVLKKNTGTEKVILKSNEALRHPNFFSNMCNLRLLIILSDLHLPLGLECLSSSLKVLHWMGCPLKDLPLGVQLDELVLLQMRRSKVRKLWNGTPIFGKLKVIDMSNSKDLFRTPDISGVSNLEELFLDGCTNLTVLHESVGRHKKLATLRLIGCVNIKILPSKLEMDSLKTLFLSGCSKVKRLPDFGEKMEYVSVLNLMNCENLLSLPNTISNLKSLRILNISGCSKVYMLPDSIKENKALEDLDLSRTSIRKVNSCIFQLKNLRRLSFSGCSGKPSNFWELPLSLEWMFMSNPAPTHLILPTFISGLSSLTILDLSYCNLSYELIPKDLGKLSSLERLILSGNEDLVLPATSIATLSKLRCLEIEGCRQEYRPLLPPHARVYPEDFAVEISLLDIGKLWKLFESRDRELFATRENEWIDWPYPIHFDVPPRFDNQNLFPVGPRLSKHDTIASIIMDIPDECRWGEWWGIAVFVALDPSVSSAMRMRNSMQLYWSFDAPHLQACPSLYLSSESTTVYGNLYLLTMIMNDNYIYIQRHRRGNRNKDDSKHFSKHWKPDFSENSKLRVEVEVEGRKIRECGWHVLCKEDFIFEASPKSYNRRVLSHQFTSKGNHKE